MTLYRPEAFERLTDTPWDEARVRSGIAAIVADADAAWRGPKLFWKAHEWDRWNATSPMKNLYVGSAGVIWALDQLRSRSFAETSLDLRDLAARSLELFRSKPDYIKLPAFTPPEPRDSGLFVGEVGILLVAWKLGHTEYLDDLRRRLLANVDNEAEEVFWGAPGSLIAAAAIGDEATWKTLATESPRRERPLDAAPLRPAVPEPDAAARPCRYRASTRRGSRERRRKTDSPRHRAPRERPRQLAAPTATRASRARRRDRAARRV